jgi:GNAT superfamily N-acetyltransferase
MISYTSELSGIDWHEAARIFEKAPLGKRQPLQLEKAFKASFACLAAFAGDKLIGLARALCDGQYQAAIYDVVLLPEYQGRGVGKEIMRRLREMLPVKNVILYAAPGREGFYAKCGYKKMLTAMAMLNPLMGKVDQYLADE